MLVKLRKLQTINKLNKQRGIGLLELMLSLSIIAILLVMATRYFMTANEQQKINNAISQINGIAGGASNYAQSNITPGYGGISIKSLVDGHFIPSSFGGTDGTGTGANPWTGNISVNTVDINGGAGFAVTMTGIPTSGTPSVCDKLANIINTSIKASAACNSGQVIVNFN